MLPPYPSTPPHTTAPPLPSRNSRKRSFPERSSRPRSAELNTPIRIRHARTKTVPLTWSLSSTCSTIPFSNNAAPPLVLLPSVELPSTPAYSSNTVTSISMKRSPGMHNLNLFTQQAFCTPDSGHGVPWNLSSRKTPTPSRRVEAHEDLSSPELPDSPDSPDSSEYAMNEDNHPHPTPPSPCAAKGVRSGVTLGRSYSAPYPPSTYAGSRHEYHRSTERTHSRRGSQAIDGWRGMVLGDDQPAVDGLGLSMRV